MSTRTLTYPEPKISKLLFASRYSVPFWTVVRIYLGYLWFVAGWTKVTNPNWVGADAGTAVRGYLQGALGRAQAEQPTVSGWYAWLIENVFLPNAVLFSYLVAFGELLVGIALIVGFLVGFSAFMGGLMNVSFLLAGTLSTNPIMFILATWLVLAWRVAGYWGLDYWVLPRLGAPRRGWKDEEGLPDISDSQKSAKST
jgi:thiosulfate dehydrogenase (quinone) large subunit